MIIEDDDEYPDPNQPIFVGDVDEVDVRFFTVSVVPAEYPWVLYDDLATICSFPVEGRAALIRQATAKFPAHVRMIRSTIPIVSQSVAYEWVLNSVETKRIDDEIAKAYWAALDEAMACQAVATRPHAPHSAIDEAYVTTWIGRGH